MTQVQEPAWMQQFRAAFSSEQAHCFILTGNVADYVVGNLTLESYLLERMARRVVVVYSVARGFLFPFGAADRREFIRRAGLEKQQPQVSSNPAFATLQAVSGVSATTDVDLPRAPSQAIPLLEAFLTWTPADGWGESTEKQAAALILNMEAIAPNAPWNQISPGEREAIVRFQEWGRDAQRFKGAVVFGIARQLEDMHDSLRAVANRWQILDIPIPDEKDRLAFIDLLLELPHPDESGPRFVLDPALSKQQMARITAGLGRIHLEDIAYQAEAQGRQVGKPATITAEMVRWRKAEIIKAEFDAVIKLVDPQFGFDSIGGKTELKRIAYRSIIRPLRSGRAERCHKGWLLGGPAGTGKSYFVQALAYEAGVNFVELDLSRIFGGIVGATEKNLERALKMIISLAPTVVFMDEVDQKVSRSQGGGDSGVSSRVFGRLLEITGAESLRGRVVWMYGSNRLDLIDDAFKRTGRVDRIVPFLVPDQAEREQGLAVMLAKVQSAVDASGICDIATATEGWTFAELNALVQKAVEVAEDTAEDEGESNWEDAPIEYEHLREALTRFKNNTQGVQFMTALTLKEVNDLDMLPPAYREQARDIPALDAQIDRLQPEPTRPRGGKREL